MTEQTPLAKAEAAVRDASANTADVAQIVAAVLAAQQANQQQVQPVPPAPRVQRPLGLYVAAGIGGAVALSFLAMAAAVLAVAVAVGAVCATVCLLVLKNLLADFQKGK